MKSLSDIMHEDDYKRQIIVHDLFDYAEALVINKSKRGGIKDIYTRSEAYYTMDIYKGNKCLRIEYERASGDLYLRVYAGKKVLLGKRPNMNKGLYKVLDLYIKNVNESNREISRINLYVPGDTSNKKGSWEDILIENGKDLAVPFYLPPKLREELNKEILRQRSPLNPL